ncbi:MAG TPA: hypothetical protein VJH65_03310 [Candidatus Nanoarchaeia archaeon]|nr:hypothetical protein [Candidatus Nanoarchaeia archaeon]
MTELTISQIIKIILGIIVVIVVISGLYFFFKDYVLDFFENIVPGNNLSKLILYLFN